MLQASCLQQLYYCTENRFVEKSGILKQPEQIQKEAAANQNSLLSQLILKTTSLMTNFRLESNCPYCVNRDTS